MQGAALTCFAVGGYAQTDAEAGIALPHTPTESRHAPADGVEGQGWPGHFHGSFMVERSSATDDEVDRFRFNEQLTLEEPFACELRRFQRRDAFTKSLAKGMVGNAIPNKTLRVSFNCCKQFP